MNNNLNVNNLDILQNLNPGDLFVADGYLYECVSVDLEERMVRTRQVIDFSIYIPKYMESSNSIVLLENYKFKLGTVCYYMSPNLDVSDAEIIEVKIKGFAPLNRMYAVRTDTQEELLIISDHLYVSKEECIALKVKTLEERKERLESNLAKVNARLKELLHND